MDKKCPICNNNRLVASAELQRLIKKCTCEKPAHRLDDILGADDMVDYLTSATEWYDDIDIDLYLAVSPVRDYLLCGGNEQDRQIIADGLASELIDQGFRYLKVDAEEIADPDTIRSLFEEALGDNLTILYIENVDKICIDRERNLEAEPDIEKRRNDWEITMPYLQSYKKLHFSKREVFFLAAADSPENMDPVFTDSVKIIMLQNHISTKQEWGCEE